ncbi:MAG: 1,4-dihydroxy-6-naphthoate synthase [Deltaproteobacteria bacterium]|nr:MAG: 1,4-dihydroxy-6-naphthoate synthase [Deltaproteobacteria bacterium]
MTTLDLGFSTCPNDTFIFHAMVHGLVDRENIKFRPRMHDVEELNRKAFSGAYHVSKLSVYACFRLKNTYEILDAGAALGYGCGPLLIARPGTRFRTQAKIAIPGEYTTARLLLQLWNPEITNVEVTRFDNILEGVKTGQYDAGLIIHEGRFVYPEYGCVKIIDLGEWWEAETGLPIPLGCIAVRKDPATVSLKEKITAVLARSVQYALDNPLVSRDFIRQHAQEMDDPVIDGHIRLYVNDFTLALGDRGRQAIQTLEEMARWKNIL